MPRRSRGMLSGARTPQLFRIGPLVDEIPGMNHTMENPSISVIVCTRNRGASVAPTIQSILGNTHHSFEVILIDQSTDNATSTAIEPFLQDHRLKFIRSQTTGKGLACNIGWQTARGEIIALTDDDCVVPPDWLLYIERAFARNSQIGLVFCSVLPAEHDTSQGYIPSFPIQKERTIYALREYWARRIGLGAGMAIRKSVLEAIGGFDCHLGPGSKFRSGDDHDIAIRTILQGFWIYELQDTAVIHYGFRSMHEGKAHTIRDWFSLGATYIKPIKCGKPQGLFVLLSRPVLIDLLQPVRDLLHLRKPRGFLRLRYFLKGVLIGLITPVEKEHLLYSTTSR